MLKVCLRKGNECLLAYYLQDKGKILASYYTRTLYGHSLTSRHFQFFFKNIPIKEQADKV